MSKRGCRPTLALAVCLGVAGCGSDGSDDRAAGTRTSGQTTTGATQEQRGDSRPRVEGRWRLVVTPREEDRPTERVTYRVRALCEAGACSFRATSVRGVARRFRFDDAIGDYTSTFNAWASCGDEAPGTTIAERAYKLRAQITLHVTEAVTTQDGDYATEMRGTMIERELLRPEYVGRCSEGRTLRYELRFVRGDPPPGEQRRVENA